MGNQQKQYRAGQKRPNTQGGGVVKSGSQQGQSSKTQGGKVHATKNRAVNHGRTR